MILSDALKLMQYKSAGRKPVVRMRMPQWRDNVFVDQIRGEVKFDHEFVPDFVLARADGSPLYTLAVAVDDVLMKITHVLRGEDLLSSTPRQIRVYQAMGITPDAISFVCAFTIRNGTRQYKAYQSEMAKFQLLGIASRGILPEAICNYLSTTRLVTR